jgi:hypothetical protein
LREDFFHVCSDGSTCGAHGHRTDRGHGGNLPRTSEHHRHYTAAVRRAGRWCHGRYGRSSAGDQRAHGSSPRPLFSARNVSGDRDLDMAQAMGGPRQLGVHNAPGTKRVQVHHPAERWHLLRCGESAEHPVVRRVRFRRLVSQSRARTDVQRRPGQPGRDRSAVLRQQLRGGAELQHHLGGWSGGRGPRSWPPRHEWPLARAAPHGAWVPPRYRHLTRSEQPDLRTYCIDRSDSVRLRQ